MPKHLETEKKTTAIAMLCEGNSIRGVERMTGIHRDTIMRLAVRRRLWKLPDMDCIGLTLSIPGHAMRFADRRQSAQ
jgi:hypothetical protein